MFDTMKEHHEYSTPLWPISSYGKYDASDAETQIECHWHDEWEFFAITKGTACISINGVKTQISTGDVVFIKGGDLHIVDSEDGNPFKFRAIVFNPVLLRLLPDDLAEVKYISPLIDGKLQLSAVLNSEAIGKNSLEIFERLHNVVLNKSPFYELFMKAYLLEFLACWMESGSTFTNTTSKLGNVETLKCVLNYIHEHYAQQISIEQLSDIAHMSQGHFTKMFYKFTSRTPMNYVIRFRLSKAAFLLINTDEKILHIAMDVGFNNLSYFLRTFKTYFGCSPTVYRKKYNSLLP